MFDLDRKVKYRRSNCFGYLISPVAILIAFMLLAGVPDATGHEDDEPVAIMAFPALHYRSSALSNTTFRAYAKQLEGVPDNQDNFIKVAGGISPIPLLFLETVRIQFTSRLGRSTCSGVIISRDTVITAGHCACGSGYLADVLTRIDNEGPIYHDIGVSSGMVRFPGYDCNRSPEQQIGRDLALFKIRVLAVNKDGNYLHVGEDGEGFVKLKFNVPTIRPNVVVLGRERGLRNLFLAGYGKDERGVRPDKLLAAYVDVFSRFCTQGFVQSSPCRIHREFVLAPPPFVDVNSRTDSCGGDSGGPAFQLENSVDVFGADTKLEVEVLSKTLVGLVSRGLEGITQPFPGFCGGGGIYTAIGVRPVLEWLDQNDVEYVYDSTVSGL